MKKLALVIVLSAAFVLMSGVAAFAAETPHGPFNANTGICAACHRAHTSSAEYLLAAPKATGLCLQCHGNGSLGADTNVFNGVYVQNGTEQKYGGAVGVDTASALSGYDHQSWGANTSPLLGGGFLQVRTVAATSMHMDPTGDAALTPFQIQFGWGATAGSAPGSTKTYLDCVDCHMPHNSPNYRMLRVRPTGTLSVSDLIVPAKSNIVSSNGALAVTTPAAATKTLAGTLYLPAGSTLAASSIVPIGTKASTQADRTAIAPAGVWSAAHILTSGAQASLGAPITFAGPVVLPINARVQIGSSLAANAASSDRTPATGDQFMLTGALWPNTYSATNPGRRYTDDNGMFNTYENTATYDSVSKWCGLGCHNFYYRSAIRADNAMTGGTMGTRLAVSYNSSAIDELSVQSLAGIAQSTILIINGVEYTVMNGPTTGGTMGNLAADNVHISPVLRYSVSQICDPTHVVTAGTPVSISGKGMELYYDLDNDTNADANFMHAIDVDLNYAPRNGAAASSLGPNLGVAGNSLGANKMPVLDQNLSGTYDSGDYLSCLTCHRAHGTEATMNVNDALIGQVALVNGAINTNTVTFNVDNKIQTLATGDRVGFLTPTGSGPVNGSNSTTYLVQSSTATSITLQAGTPVRGDLAVIADNAILTNRIINRRVFPGGTNSMLLRLENRAVCQQCHMMPSGF